jgi:hypothetical protein
MKHLDAVRLRPGNSTPEAGNGAGTPGSNDYISKRRRFRHERFKSYDRAFLVFNDTSELIRPCREAMSRLSLAN